MIDRKKLTFLIAILIGGIASSACAQQGDLVRGFSSESNEKELFLRFVRELNRYPSHMLKEPTDPEIYYAFSGKTVGKYRVKEDEIDWLGGWPLTRWEHGYLEDEVKSTYYDGFYPSVYGDQYVADSEKLTHLMGCMQASPLRFGDIDNNGSSEVVLFLSDQVSTDILVFSPNREKVIFASKLSFTDSLKYEEIPDNYLRDSEHQYVSWRNIWAGEPSSSAIRAYGKLYFGDFDEDGARDILVWRKLYESYLRNEEEQGFKKIGEKWLHYSFVEGEYVPQETPEADIQAWLADNNLTWQQGYPNQSECPGEEGELIPEMHDPLLNDPDVLK